VGIREIADDDLDAVVSLLVEGFPQRSSAYWRRGLEHLLALPAVPGYPRFGYLIEDGRQAQGLMLLITSRVGETVRSSLSSWYVREKYRTTSVLLYKHAIRKKGGVYLNLSASANVLPIVSIFGFKAYTTGICLLDFRAALRASSGWTVTNMDANVPTSFSAETLELAARHQRFGCAALVLERGEERPELLLYRVKHLKGALPCAQFLYGHPSNVLKAAAPLMRHLLRRGMPAALVDVGSTTTATQGRLFLGRNVRYALGAAPEVGDMLNSELAIFGP
jgi:hypothetical protein